MTRLPSSALPLLLASFVVLGNSSLAGSAEAQTKPLVTQADLGKWESLGNARLSPNGNWLAWTIVRGNEESELRMRSGPADSIRVVPYGQSAAFSADSRWIAYLTGVSPKERDRLVK